MAEGEGPELTASLTASVQQSAQAVDLSAALVESIRNSAATLQSVSRRMDALAARAEADAALAAAARRRRRTCNVLFAVALGFGFLCVGAYATYKFALRT